MPGGCARRRMAERNRRTTQREHTAPCTPRATRSRPFRRRPSRGSCMRPEGRARRRRPGTLPHPRGAGKIRRRRKDWSSTPAGGPPPVPPKSTECLEHCSSRSAASPQDTARQRTPTKDPRADQQRLGRLSRDDEPKDLRVGARLQAHAGRESSGRPGHHHIQLYNGADGRERRSRHGVKPADCRQTRSCGVGPAGEISRPRVRAPRHRGGRGHDGAQARLERSRMPRSSRCASPSCTTSAPAAGRGRLAFAASDMTNRRR